MNQQQQPSFMPVMFPFPQQNQQSHRQHQDIPPARVQVALEVLQQFNFKTMPRAAVNDISIEWSERAELSNDEKMVRSAACDLLRDYFQGDLRLTRVEDLMVDQIEGSVVEEVGHHLVCHACANKKVNGYTCELCGGSGHIIIYPGNRE